ncbi:hypothetical protein [Streptomyces coffeae]|uniref:hypothetical protein n=1 Tax=Streptomyces coffeae TaxID=621382 RepID=UPI001F37B070|nr:hypothetical protein [Streptomyces coffeae]
MRRHRELLSRRHAATCAPKQCGRPRTIRSIRALVLREHGTPPTPERQSTTWADFLRNQDEALLTCDLFEVRTLTGTRLYVFAVIEHITRRIRIPSAGAHATGGWIVQLGRNLLMDLQDAGSRARFLIRDRDSKFTAAFDALMIDAGLKVVTTSIRIPRMNSLMERWIQTCRTPHPRAPEPPRHHYMNQPKRNPAVGIVRRVHDPARKPETPRKPLPGRSKRKSG